MSGLVKGVTEGAEHTEWGQWRAASALAGCWLPQMNMVGGSNQWESRFQTASPIV